ncbi:hypothetical protein AB0B60_28140 [Streptomyces lincolnensis]|uniref:hypothetical protein n=1 Tax=Streptomyces lincolnensis TaxID=1915 RepID=UPI0013520B70
MEQIDPHPNPGSENPNPSNPNPGTSRHKAGDNFNRQNKLGTPFAGGETWQR